ncbi:MAG: bifunctional 4-hydroxy-2-oxoglutarate aldolase/2-dehydro-3-deoxy-phosphogluconate aldolase [Bacteroidetes bacterium]|nr:bifunctional 4-hydroxy-2-oxoglutarate aldolase/2-dehydro-3-deoxy-phosphogluconate aldolase [Bacteroidota bacterium]
MPTKFKWDIMHRIPIIGILRNYSAECVRKLLPVYYKAGMTTIEVTMNSPHAVEIIREAVDNFGDKLNVGAGTVRNPKELEKALEAGAQFIVTPVLDEEVVRLCRENEVPVFPGAFTPTEVFRAWEAGADAVKIFPASLGGPTYIKTLLGPLDQIKLIPTGGVSSRNITDYLNAGACGLGMGGNLVPKDWVEDGEWASLERHFVHYVAIINYWREKG